MGQGTKDVTQAQMRTDMDSRDTLLLVNAITKEVEQLDIEVLANKIAADTAIAPADYVDFFGV